MGPLYCPCKEVVITSLWLYFDLPNMTPGESNNEWCHYYFSKFYLFNIIEKKQLGLDIPKWCYIFVKTGVSIFFMS